MADWQDDPQEDYEEFKRQWRGTTAEDLKSGDWFATLVRWILSNYAKTVDAAYICRKYPGASPADQAKKVITLASRFNGIAGGSSAAAITALELSSFGPQALVTVPAAGSLVALDVALSSRTQLRATYDLSVIHKAPLSLDDADDCYLVFLTALGIKLHELVGGAAKTVGPRVVAYNVRKLLRTGLRKALQVALAKIGGVRLGRTLTERAMMRLLVPGISIPIASGFSYYFTRKVLRVANAQMARRGAIVQPLVRLYTREPRLSKTFGPKVLIALADLGDPEGWFEGQMEALRHCQSALSLSDEELAEMGTHVDRGVADVIKAFPEEFAKGREDLVELAVVQAAFAADNRYDTRYGEAITTLATACGASLASDTALKRVQEKRRLLQGKTGFSWFF